MKTEETIKSQTCETEWSWEQASPLTKVAVGLIEFQKMYPLVTIQEVAEDSVVIEEFSDIDIAEVASRGIGWKALDDQKNASIIAGELVVFAGIHEENSELAKQLGDMASVNGIDFVVPDLENLWNLASQRLDLSTLPIESNE